MIYEIKLLWNWEEKSVSLEINLTYVSYYVIWKNRAKELELSRYDFIL